MRHLIVRRLSIAFMMSYYMPVYAHTHIPAIAWSRVVSTLIQTWGKIPMGMEGEEIGVFCLMIKKKQCEKVGSGW